MRGKYFGAGLAMLVFLMMYLTACGSDDTEVPSGFISLSETINKTNGSLRYVAWESQISFLDADDNTIYQTGFENKDFIVKYKDKYYINEAKYLEMVGVSKANTE